MYVLLILLSYFALYANLGVSSDLSSTSSYVLITEHTILLGVSWLIIHQTLKKAKTTDKQRFYNCFLIGYIISLIYLHYGWTPNLSPDNENWGFDPQRYYIYAISIIRGTGLEYLLNYQGVVYFFVFAMRILGIDPLVPLFVNVILSLYATLLISRLISRKQKKTLKYFSFLLLIPEVFFYNAMPSREILCMAFFTIFLCKYYEMSLKRTTMNIILMILAFSLLSFIRIPIAIFAIMVVVFHVGKSQSRSRQIIIAVFMIGALLISQQISNELDSASNVENLGDSFQNRVSGNNNLSEKLVYSENSFTEKLIPHNTIEFFIFGFIRSFFYILPTPSTITNPLSLFSFKGLYWSFEPLTTVTIFILLIPLIRFIRKYHYLADFQKLLIIAFIILFFSIGMSLTTLIQMRYRVVYNLILFSLCINACLKQKYMKNNPITNYKTKHHLSE